MSMWERIKSWFRVETGPGTTLPGFTVSNVARGDFKTTFTLNALDNNEDTMALFYGRKEETDEDVEEAVRVAAEASDDGHQVPRMSDAHHGASGRDPLGRVQAPGVTGAQAGMEGEGRAMTELEDLRKAKFYLDRGIRMLEDARTDAEVVMQDDPEDDYDIYPKREDNHIGWAGPSSFFNFFGPGRTAEDYWMPGERDGGA